MTLLLTSTIKVSFILLFALGATALLRKRSAAIRHLVLSAAVVCAVALPAVEWVVPAWHLPLDTSSLVRLEPAPGASRCRGNAAAGSLRCGRTRGRSLPSGL